MTYTFALTIHLIGACLTGIVASYAGIALWQKRDIAYRASAIILGALAGFEVLTGVALSVISPKITSISLCANIAVYLSVVFSVEALLFLRMKKISIVFPIMKVFSPIVTSLLFLLGAILYGF